MTINTIQTTDTADEAMTPRSAPFIGTVDPVRTGATTWYSGFRVIRQDNCRWVQITWGDRAHHPHACAEVIDPMHPASFDAVETGPDGETCRVIRIYTPDDGWAPVPAGRW